MEANPCECRVTRYPLASGDHLPLAIIYQLLSTCGAAKSPAHGKVLAGFVRTGLSRILESEGCPG